MGAPALPSWPRGFPLPLVKDELTYDADQLGMAVKTVPLRQVALIQSLVSAHARASCLALASLGHARTPRRGTTPPAPAPPAPQPARITHPTLFVPVRSTAALAFPVPVRRPTTTRTWTRSTD